MNPTEKYSYDNICEFSPEEYSQVASHLLEAIGERDFLSTTISVTFGTFDATLIATLIIYRTPEGDIRDVVPVWWEMHTHDLTDGKERLNDFSFGELRGLLAVS